MKRIMSIMFAVFAAFLVGLAVPPQAAATNPTDPQDTDVAIVREEYYQQENSEQTNGGTSEQAPDYHDLYVTPDNKTVTFHNYVKLHDERLTSEQFYIKFYIWVWESFGESNQTLVKYEFTFDLQYHPPTDYSNIQTISIDVNYNGVGTHEYDVGSEYKWYHVSTDGSTHDSIPFRDITYLGHAYVHEVPDLPPA